MVFTFHKFCSNLWGCGSPNWGDFSLLHKTLILRPRQIPLFCVSSPRSLEIGEARYWQFFWERTPLVWRVNGLRLFIRRVLYADMCTPNIEESANLILYLVTPNVLSKYYEVRSQGSDFQATCRYHNVVTTIM